MVKEQWDLIVKHYKRERNALEEKIESDWIDMLVEIFGYKKLLGEIDVHRSIQIGSGERAIPDVIVRSADKDLFLIEFKRYTSVFNEKMEAQLKSYLDLLHLSIGIIVCQKIYVYSYKDGKLKKCEIEFYEKNKNGEEFLELFKRGKFTKEKVEEYVDSYKNVDTEVEEILKVLTAPGVMEILKRHFSAKPYSDEAIEKAFEKRIIIVTEIGPTPPQPREEETIQDWVKRIFKYLLRNNILPAQIIASLHDEDYSKRTFGIMHPMFVDNQIRTVISGHSRYWQTPIEGYYICSQWWLGKDREYESKIRLWLDRVCPNYKERGLDRRYLKNSVL